jgi:hypothetical protein
MAEPMKPEAPVISILIFPVRASSFCKDRDDRRSLVHSSYGCNPEMPDR